MTYEEMQAAIYLLQTEVTRLRDEQTQQRTKDAMEASPPSDLEKSQAFARDDEASKKLNLGAIAKKLVGSDDNSVTSESQVLAAAVRGPYVVVVLDDGSKVAISHGQPDVKAAPRVSPETATTAG
jgi:hypothetical protein